MLFYLIRHGESLYNAEGRIQGQSDVALSPLGLRQAEAIADALAEEQIDAVFASPLRRAMQSAEPIAARFGLTIQSDDRLKEIHAGIFQGLLWAEIEAEFPDAARPWREQHPDFVIPGGESRRSLMVRGLAVFESIRESPFRRVVVMSHGGILAAALKAVLRIPAEVNPFSLYNASISKLAWSEKVKLLTLNQLDHLRAAGLAREDATGSV
ncbi:MAG: histidine phosphatase family protein [Pirellulales bacterium]